MKAFLLAVLLLALVAVTVLLVRPQLPWRSAEQASPSPRFAAPAATPTPEKKDAAATGYRLAGVAVGGPGAFAVVADPNGETTLYRVGEEVPGLGELVRIEERRAFFAGGEGEIELRVRPAATATPDRRSPTPARKTTPPRTRLRAPAGTVGESLP